MAKKKLDWKTLALYGGGGLFVLWLLKKPANAGKVAQLKPKAQRGMLMGEPLLARYVVDDIGGVKSCFDLRKGYYAPNIECDRQLTAPTTDKNYWSKV